MKWLTNIFLDSDTLSPEDQEYRRETCISLFKETASAILLSLIFAVILSVSHWKDIGTAEIISWNLILFSVLIFRFAVWVVWKVTSPTTNITYWLNLARLGILLTGAAWGISTYFLFSQVSALQQALLAFTLAGVVGGSLSALSMDRPSAIGFVILAVIPLSLSLIAHGGPSAIHMFLMTICFIFFVLHNTNQGQERDYRNIKNNFLLKKTQNKLKLQSLVNNIIDECQIQFINDENSRSVIQFLLDKTLEISNSKLGFIGRVIKDDDNNFYIKSITVSGDPISAQHLLEFYVNHLSSSDPERKDNALGESFLNGKPIISNNSREMARSEGLLPSHPHLGSLLEIPIYNHFKKTGLIALANNPDGYTEEHIEYLQPLLNTFSQFIQIFAKEEAHEKDKAALKEYSVTTNTIMEHMTEAVIMIDDKSKIQFFNAAAEEIFGYGKNETLHKDINILIPDADKPQYQEFIANRLHARKKINIKKTRHVKGIRKNGEIFPIELSLSLVLQKTEPRFIGIIRDTSKEKVSQDIINVRLKNNVINYFYAYICIKNLIYTHGNILSTDEKISLIKDIGKTERNLATELSNYFIHDGNNATTLIDIREISEKAIKNFEWVAGNRSITVKNGNLTPPVFIRCDEDLLYIILVIIIHKIICTTTSNVVIVPSYTNHLCVISCKSEGPLISNGDSEDFLTLGGTDITQHSLNAKPLDLRNLLSLFQGEIFMVPHNTNIDIRIELPRAIE